MVTVKMRRANKTKSPWKNKFLEKKWISGKNDGPQKNGYTKNLQESKS